MQGGTSAIRKRILSFDFRTVADTAQACGGTVPFLWGIRVRGAVFTEEAERQLELLARFGADSMPVCVAKTPYSFTGDQSLIGAPEGFDLLIRDLKISAGAGFVVALAGDIMTMPGLPSSPAAERIHIADDGTVDGLF